MGSVKQQPIIVWAQYQAGKLGWQGVTGLALLLISILVGMAVGWPKARALDKLEMDVAKMHQAMPRHQGQWIDKSPQASLNTFYQFLPRENEATTLLASILETAEGHGLIPDKVDYVLSRHHAAHFSTYQITLPVHGSYMEIRSFISQVLNTIPASALNEISLKREDITSETVEARLRFTLYLQKDDS
ncbi:type 4a pilus biogenesis protein PilO [Methylobacillus gramineus]|uniref:type 4a pilus biogenesis protein PilO n=1 Tax=Methylobacillus gramineus TaxID=755169 RepID=UPI001D0018B0|nr:type 4a pilus biogenesis protein PilO [Methylobacillus gramineus]MCB5183831.1 type 4a pilus biogenesis protein PilO [Methylobacillus gramineus]